MYEKHIYVPGEYDFEINTEFSDGKIRTDKVTVIIGENGIPVFNHFIKISEDDRIEMLDQIKEIEAGKAYL